MKKLLSFLFHYSPTLVILALVGSVFMGAANTLLISLINEGISNAGQENPPVLVWSFVALCAFVPIARFCSQFIITFLSHKAIFDLRMLLSRQIISAPMRRLEEQGSGKLLASLTTDIGTLTGALTMIPNTCMSFTIILTCFVYLFWLYYPAGLMLLGATVVGVTIYVLILRRAEQYFDDAREVNDDLFSHFDALTSGSKELKLHQKRRKSFFSDLLGYSASFIRKNMVMANVWFTLGGSVGQILFFVVIGLLVFTLAAIDPAVDQHVLQGFSLALLYIFVPLEAVTGVFPMLSNASVSLAKIESLGLSLRGYTAEKEAEEGPRPDWKTLEYREITHTYHREKEDQTFTMGPLSLKFEPGELVFLVGGNGSGKTTLAKMLVGLYTPETGQVLFDGEEINDDNRDNFRQSITAIFSDFYLFETMLGIEQGQIDEKVRRYLEKLQLEHKVKFEDDKLSTIDLSQGQRKRLALLTAYLEDRPIYLFDEWAADQDPLFKDFFYKVLLPELRDKGKTVIVISHDDHYYYLADRIIKLDYGQLEFDRTHEELEGMGPIFDLGGDIPAKEAEAVKPKDSLVGRAIKAIRRTVSSSSE